ncbi:MAG: universal stress protein [Nitrospirota bacterium]|nr:universal stress protein [Nitrospirota bacterium]
MQLLVAVDFSDSSRIVIEYVTDLANVVCGKIWLLHVAEPDPEFVGYDVDPPEMRDVIARRFHKEHLQIQQLSQELRSKGLDCDALLIQGPTVETILRESKKLSVDMVVVGSHGKGILKHLLVGSTSEGVLHQASIPVLVVPTHGRNA